MSQAMSEPKLLVPRLKPFYDFFEPLSWVLIRLTVGLMIIPHGWPKLTAGVAATAANALIKRGIGPAEPLAVVLIVLETVGGVCVALGLATRFFAAAIFITQPSGAKLPFRITSPPVGLIGLSNE